MSAPPSTLQKGIILGCSMLTVMSGATIAPSLPAMQEVFSKVPMANILVPLVLTAPALVIAFTGFFMGYLVDSVGRIPVLAAGLVLFAIAGSSGLWLSSLHSLLVGRMFLGLAVGAVMTASTTLVTDYFDGGTRQSFMGIQSAFMAGGGVFFLVGGGLLADLHWRAPFAVYLAALLLAPGVFLKLRETRDEAAHRAASATGDRVPIPWVTMSVIFGVGGLGMMLFYLIPVKLPYYIKELGGTSTAIAGYALATSTFVGALAALQYRRLRQALSREAICAIVFGLMACAYTLLARIDSVAWVFPAMILNGVGIGLLMPNMSIWLAERSPDHARGKLVGALSSCMFLGQFLSPLAVQPVLKLNGLGGALGVYGAAGLVSFAICGAFFAYVALKGRRDQTGRSSPRSTP